MISERELFENHIHTSTRAEQRYYINK